MGDGLKKVAKLCGGLTASDRDGTTVEYDADGRRLFKKGDRVRLTEAYCNGGRFRGQREGVVDRDQKSPGMVRVRKVGSKSPQATSWWAGHWELIDESTAAKGTGKCKT